MTAPTPRPTRYLDFDEMLAETAEAGPEPLTIRLLGRDWTMPADPPAREMLIRKRAVAAIRRVNIARAKAADEGREFTADEEASMLAQLGAGADAIYTRDPYDHAAALVGKANLDAWLDAGVGWDVLSAVVQTVESAHDTKYTGPPADDTDTGEGSDGPPAAPAEAAGSDGPGTTSSPAGRSSKPTSNGSTTLTSPPPSVTDVPGDGSPSASPDSTAPEATSTPT